MVCLLSPPAAGWSTWFCFGRWNQEVSCLGTTLLYMWGFFTNGYGIFAWHILRNCFGNCSTLSTQAAHLVLAKLFQSPSTTHNTFLTLYSSGQPSEQGSSCKSCLLLWLPPLFKGARLNFYYKKYSRIKIKTLIQCDFSLAELHLEHGPHPRSSETIQCCLHLTFHFRAKLGKLRLALHFKGAVFTF